MTPRGLTVWLLETLGEVLLLMAFLMFPTGSYGERHLVRDSFIAFIGIVVVFMFGSGYLLSTAIFGFVWRSRRPCLYPSIAAVLFVAHEQILFTGWKWPTDNHLRIQAAGACIAFACTYVGGVFLRRPTNLTKGNA